MSQKPPHGTPDYLIIGHITKDQTDTGFRLGGTAIYSAVLAKRMGANVALFTSGADNLPLDILKGIQLFNQPGSGTTTFNNAYTPSGRVQTLLERAADLDLDQLPSKWLGAKIIHLAPVAGELPITAGEAFPDAALAYSLQGWMRKWDDAGRISSAPLPDGSLAGQERVAAILSNEDLSFDRSGLLEIKKRFPLVLLTLGAKGAELHWGEDIQVINPHPAREVDPTGAGDIFAGAFMVSWILEGRSTLEAARLANRLAAVSVTREGGAGIPLLEEIRELQRVHD